MKRTPLKRKTPLRSKRASEPFDPDREPWIPPKPKEDLSRMDCCAEAKARALFLVMRPCCACKQRGTLAQPGKMRRPDDMVVHHIRKGTGGGARAFWWRTLGLHEKCHADTFQVSVHGARSDEFRRLYGSEEEMLAEANAAMPPELTRPTKKQEGQLKTSCPSPSPRSGFDQPATPRPPSEEEGSEDAASPDATGAVSTSTLP